MTASDDLRRDLLAAAGDDTRIRAGVEALFQPPDITDDRHWFEASADAEQQEAG